MRRLLAERADRPFGDVEAISGRTLQPFSVAGEQAATNLLNKASRALDNDEPDRARAFVDRATRLPFDDHEETAPAANAAHMALFNLVADAIEASEVDDSGWLDALLDVLATADASARCEIRDVLATIDKDYKVSRGERARLRSAIAPIPERPELRDLRLTSAELGELIMSVLAVCRRYRLALRAQAD